MLDSKRLLIFCLALLLSTTSYAQCIPRESNTLKAEGRLSIKERQLFFIGQHNWCNDNGEDSLEKSIIHIPEKSIPRQVFRLIKRHMVQDQILLTGKLTNQLNNDQVTYSVKPSAIYVIDMDMDLLKDIRTSKKHGGPKSIEFIAEAASKDDDPASMPSMFPAFPNPVPTPSKRTNIDLFTQNEILTGELTLGDAEKKLRTALKDGDYEELSYYSFDNGFAIATPLEQTDDAANPLADGRWVKDVKQSEVFSLGSFLKALFLADEGYFRVLVFIINDKPIEFGEKVDKQTLMNVVDKGSNRLPAIITQRTFSETMLCTALVYEFEHDENTQSIINKKPGRHSVKRHLTSTNVNQSLDL